MFIAITTSNYPDVMMPAYHQTRAAPLFFITYMILGLYLLTNLVLAVVYNNFTHFEKAKFQK